MSSAQGWALVVAILSAGMTGWWSAIGALLALLFLLVDDRARDVHRRQHEGGDG